MARMKEAKEDGYGNVFITRRGVLMVDGNDLGSVDAMELKFDDENDIIIFTVDSLNNLYLMTEHYLY